MSLYYEAASILSDDSGGGSLKSRIYNDTSKLKSRPAQLYALITETAKYDAFLSEVINNAGILSLEPKVCSLCLLYMRVAAD
jgi:25S rRNA (cytosine2278-C5)-methyltransferase